MYKVAGGIIVYMYCEEVFDVYYCIGTWIYNTTKQV